jgi:hypothetical protein
MNDRTELVTTNYDRRTFIGGSDIPKIIGVSEYGDQFSLYLVQATDAHRAWRDVLVEATERAKQYEAVRDGAKANTLLAGMAARHAPVQDEREVEPSPTEQQEQIEQDQRSRGDAPGTK